MQVVVTEAFDAPPHLPHVVELELLPLNCNAHTASFAARTSRNDRTAATARGSVEAAESVSPSSVPWVLRSRFWRQLECSCRQGVFAEVDLVVERGLFEFKSERPEAPSR